MDWSVGDLCSTIKVIKWTRQIHHQTGSNMARYSELRVRQLDSALAALRPVQLRRPPHGGWVRTVRETLGMSVRQLAERAGLSRNAVANVERTEARGTARLDSLSRLAEAMDCHLFYAFVPRESFEETLDRESRRAAEALVGRVAVSMELEEQGTSSGELARRAREVAAELRRHPRRIWDVPR